ERVRFGIAASRAELPTPLGPQGHGVDLAGTAVFLKRQRRAGVFDRLLRPVGPAEQEPGIVAVIARMTRITLQRGEVRGLGLPRAIERIERRQYAAVDGTQHMHRLTLRRYAPAVPQPGFRVTLRAMEVAAVDMQPVARATEGFGRV